MCQQLGVPVRAHWKACQLAARPFSGVWEGLEGVVALENALSLSFSEALAGEKSPDKASRETQPLPEKSLISCPAD